MSKPRPLRRRQRTPAADASPAPTARTRKIAILGFGPTVRECPWRDTSWELWSMNGFWRAALPDYGIDAPEARYSRWFDTHSLEYTRAYGQAAGFGDAQERWLEKEHPFPIYMLEAYPQFPSVRQYPVGDVVAALGRDYFTSTIAYALALALTLPDVAELGLWGIDLAHGTEYEQQRPCAEYWIGRAEAMGIKVTIHQRSALLNNRGQRYGYEDKDSLLAQMRGVLMAQANTLEAAITKRREEMDQMRCQMHTDDGARQVVRQLLERLDVFERGGQI